MLIKRIEELMPDSARFILEQLHNQNFKAYLVGGCVRDCILGKTPSDWDICTSATPMEVMYIFNKYYVIPTGLKHGTITVVIENEEYEITTFRNEKSYSDNRRPDVVTFIDDVKEDLARRDFTINAIAYNSEEGFIDPFNGISDIEKSIIKCVGKPEDRFNEDGLRILRALRFAAKFGFEIENKTSEAIMKQYNLLSNISKERINVELCKILMSENAGINILREYNQVFGFIIPELKQTFDFNQNNPHHKYEVWEHTLHALENTEEDLIIRLAILLHDIGKPITYSEDETGKGHFYGHAGVSAEMSDEILKELKFSNEIRNNVVELILNHDRVLEPRKSLIKRCLRKIGEDQTRRLLKVKMADIMGQDTQYEEWNEKYEKLIKIEEILEEILKEEACFKISDLKINGNDLINLGIPQGIEIGRILNALLEMVINEEIKNETEVLREKVRDLKNE